MRLGSFLLRRFIRLLVSLAIISVVTFALLSLAPGSFAGIQATGGGGLASGRNREIATQVAARFGEEIPVWQQYLNWLVPALRGDLGYSYKYSGSTVQDLIIDRLGVSLALATIAMIVALLIAVPIGIAAAYWRNSAVDHVSMFTMTTLTAFPTYLAAILLILFFSGWLGVLPTGGWKGPAYAVMPILALALAPAGILARYVRSSVLEVLNEEYVVAAIAKGGKTVTVLRRHVLRNALMPLVTVAGPMLAGLVVGTIFIETIFSVPGLGGLFTQAALVRDMPLLMGTTLMFASLLIIANILVDLAYAVIDPRTRGELGLGANTERKRARSAA